MDADRRGVCGTLPGTVLVLSDDCGVGECLAGQLRHTGSRVVTTARGGRFAEPGEFGLRARPGPARRVGPARGSPGVGRVHTRRICTPVGAGRAGANGDDIATDIADLRRLVRLAGSRSALLVHVTRHVLDITGEDPIRPELTAAIGICRVVPQESALRCRVIETDPRPLTDHLDSLVERLIAELGTAEPRPPVLAIRGRRSLPPGVGRGPAITRGSREPARGVHW